VTAVRSCRPESLIGSLELASGNSDRDAPATIPEPQQTANRIPVRSLPSL